MDRPDGETLGGPPTRSSRSGGRSSIPATRTRPPIVVTATPGRLADVPNLVASRLWLRSVQRPDGQLASTASYRLETHGRSIVIRLPAGSRWVRGRAGSVELGANHVEQVDPTTYQVTLPSIVGAGPIEFRVETVLDSELFEGSWPVPDLVGGVVQQTAWELSLLGARAGVGVPDGWTDENVWIREGLIWMRQPRRSESDLARWLADGQPLPLPGSPNLRLPGTLVGSPSEPISAQGWSGAFAGGPHSYLFSRPRAAKHHLVSHLCPTNAPPGLFGANFGGWLADPGPSAPASSGRGRLPGARFPLLDLRRAQHGLPDRPVVGGRGSRSPGSRRRFNSCSTGEPGWPAWSGRSLCIHRRAVPRPAPRFQATPTSQRSFVRGPSRSRKRPPSFLDSASRTRRSDWWIRIDPKARTHDQTVAYLRRPGNPRFGPPW